MAGIDASIPLQGRVAQIEPEMNRLARALAIQSAISQNTAAQMAIEETQNNRVRQQQMRDILARGGTADDLLRGGFVTEANAIRKSNLEDRKTTAEIDAKTLDSNLKILNAGLQAGASLLNSKEPLTRQHVVSALTPHIQAGVVPMAFATKFVQGLPEDDAGIRETLKRGMLSSMSAREQLEAMLPKVSMQDTGGQIVPVNTNPMSKEPLGPIAGAPALTKSMTPGEVATNKLGWYNANKPQFLPVEGVGVFVGSPRTGTVAPAMQSNGQPLTMPSKGQNAVDTDMAKEYTSYVANGGYADVLKQLAQLKEARDTLAGPDGQTARSDISGPVRGMLPDKVRAVTNPDAIRVKNLIEEVVQRNLRVVLGAQFTEKEGERLIARAFNPQADPADNLRRLDRLMAQVAVAAQQKEQAMRYFEQNGTLRGFQGRLPSIADFNPDADVPKPITQGGGAGAAPVIPVPGFPGFTITPSSR
jgi:hypothetical protein